MAIACVSPFEIQYSLFDILLFHPRCPVRSTCVVRRGQRPRGIGDQESPRPVRDARTQVSITDVAPALSGDDQRRGSTIRGPLVRPFRDAGCWGASPSGGPLRRPPATCIGPCRAAEAPGACKDGALSQTSGPAGSPCAQRKLLLQNTSETAKPPARG